MDIIINAISPVSIFTMLFIIVALIVAFYKKYTITHAIIAICFVVYIISLIFSNEIIGDLAFKPIYLSLEQSPQLYTLFSSMFLHSVNDPLHLIFNMFMFILIATSFEDRIGAKKFLAIYLITGVCAALFHALFAPLLAQGSFMPYDANIGLIGASGAISGILGAYAISYPKDKVFFPLIFIIRMPVLVAGVIFLAFQTFYIFIGLDSSVAYLAHVGGFISGIIIAAIFIRNKGKGLYEPVKDKRYDFYAPEKQSKIDIKKLKELATTDELKEIIKKIENENVEQVRDIWLEHFFEKVRCPKCSGELNHLENRVWCEKCGFKTKF